VRGSRRRRRAGEARSPHGVLPEEAARAEEAQALVVLEHLHLPLHDEVHLGPDLALLGDQLPAQRRHRVHDAAEVRQHLLA
jgi:hypothetical protein